MGKRSDFERKPRDFYPTPFAAVEPLIDHLPNKFTFYEHWNSTMHILTFKQYLFQELS